MAREATLKADSARHALHRFLTGEIKSNINPKTKEKTDEHVGFCPVCEDPESSASPSASFNFEKMVYSCKGKCSASHPTGAAGGGIAALLRQMKDQTGFDIRSERLKGANAEGGNPIVTFNVNKKEEKSSRSSKVTQAYVDSWARKLQANTPALEELTSERGFDPETIRKFEIGWDGQRYTIPVRDMEGTLVNIRRYKLNASRDKMLNIQGYGGVQLFNAPTLLAATEVILSEGETDAILLEQNGFNACCATAGAGTFNDSLAQQFRDKVVYVCYDSDDAGNQGAAKAGKLISVYAREVYKVEIPLPTKGADVTDFLYKEGNTNTDFRRLMSNAIPIHAYKKMVAEEAPSEGTPVSLEASMAHRYQEDILEVVGTISGKQNPPFKVPKRFSVTCNMSKGPICQQCPVFFRDGNMSVEIAEDDTQLFRFLDTNDEKFPKIMKAVSGAMCADRAQFDVEESYYLEELVVGNSVDSREADADQKPVTRQIFSVNTHATEVNSVVKMVGKNVANPRNQRLSFMAWRNEPVRTSLDSFELSDEIRKQMLAFQVTTNDPDNPQTPLEKCLEISDDIAQHVTRIYGRDLLHVAYDLVWHSPLSFEVEGRKIEKGWLECAVVGDTRTGKSEAALQLSRHYRAGVLKSCEGATFAGLVGGVQQMGSGNWITTWGVIPLNDRRLVALDEVSGLKDKDVIENMSSIRSSGLAQIVKIDTQETSARTRLIWIFNPGGDGGMIDERPGMGMDALRSVVKQQEDIARFDFVLAARASEVQARTINQTHKPKTPQAYTQDMCSNLVLWAWSLKPEQIKFTASAVREARQIAEAIGDEYVADPPLLQAENARFKLYRIAAAIAARTFHIEWVKKDEMQLVVNADHVKDAKRFLDLIYGQDQGMGYRASSKRLIDARQRAKGNRVNAKNYLIEHLSNVYTTLQSVATSGQGSDGKFRQRDFEEFGGMTRDAALAAVSELLKMGMVHRLTQGYIRMDKHLVSVLRQMEEEDY